MAGDNDFNFNGLEFRRIDREHINTLKLHIETRNNKTSKQWEPFNCYCFFIQNLHYHPQPDINVELGTNGEEYPFTDNTFEYYYTSLLYKLCNNGFQTGIRYNFPKTNWLIWDDYGIKMYNNIDLIPVNVEDLKFKNNDSIEKYLKKYNSERGSSSKFYLIMGESDSNYIKGIFRIKKLSYVFVDNVEYLRDYGNIDEVFPKFYDVTLYEKLSSHNYTNTDPIVYNEVSQYLDFNYFSLKYHYQLFKDGVEAYTRIAYIPFETAFYLHFHIRGTIAKKNSSLSGKMAEVLELEDLKQRRLERIHEEERIAWEKKYKYKYNTVNRCSRDNFISFDETNHTYTVDGKILQSVTNIVENCFPKFDAELHAKNTAAKMGITPEEVIAMWEQKGKESRELGTAMHQKIEKYYQGEDSYEDDAFKLFKVFAEKVQLVPYRTEWAVYDTDYNVAGTIDFVDCQDGKFTIYDWKRSDKIIANGMPVKVSKYQEKGLYPLEHLENCAYYHYALQLSLYKFILEKNYDIKVSDLRLGIFHPSYDKPYVLKIPYLESEVKTLMELRSEVIL